MCRSVYICHHHNLGIQVGSFQIFRVISWVYRYSRVIFNLQSYLLCVQVGSPPELGTDHQKLTIQFHNANSHPPFFNNQLTMSVPVPDFSTNNLTMSVPAPHFIYNSTMSVLATCYLLTYHSTMSVPSLQRQYPDGGGGVGHRSVRHDPPPPLYPIPPPPCQY